MDANNFLEVHYKYTGRINITGQVDSVNSDGTVVKRNVRSVPMGIFIKDTDEMIYENKNIIRSWGKIV